MDDIAYFYPEGHEAHYEPGHPERPDRVEAIVSALRRADLWERYPRLEAQELAREVLEGVHSRRYLETLKQASAQGMRLDADTYTTPASWDLALQAAGGAVAAARAVWHGAAQRAFALTRPPGHHATPNRGMGFCLLNNVALAAEDLLRLRKAYRVAIVDLDLHHGNGTQDVFYRRGDVFYFSTHQSPHYPGTGRVNEMGIGPGAGFNANFPLPAYSGDTAFAAVMAEGIMPLLDLYYPEIILVSVGFDTHWRDPLGMLLLSASGLGRLVRTLADWADQNCKGRIALFLEGGYDLDAAGACSTAAVQALLGKPIDDPLGASPYEEGDEWKGMLGRMKEIWALEG